MNTEAMPTKAEFKFNCPTCGQHILAATEWIGQHLNCPSCQAKITIPSPPSGTASAPPAISPRPTKPTIRIELPPKPVQDAAGSNGQLLGLNERAAFVPPSVTGHESWPEFVQKLEQGALAEPAMLATALFRELTNVRRRLAEVERKLADQQPNSGGNGAVTKPATVMGN